MGKDRTEEIARGIAASRGHPGLLDALASLSPSELSSVLMHALRRVAREREMPELRAVHAPMFGPSSADPRVLNRIDRAAYAASERFEPIDLAPVMPLGAA